MAKKNKMKMKMDQVTTILLLIFVSMFATFYQVLQDPAFINALTDAGYDTASLNIFTLALGMSLFGLIGVVVNSFIWTYIIIIIAKVLGNKLKFNEIFLILLWINLVASLGLLLITGLSFVL